MLLKKTIPKSMPLTVYPRLKICNSQFQFFLLELTWEPSEVPLPMKFINFKPIASRIVLPWLSASLLIKFSYLKISPSSRGKRRGERKEMDSEKREAGRRRRSKMEKRRRGRWKSILEKVSLLSRFHCTRFTAPFSLRFFEIAIFTGQEISFSH